MGQNEWYHFGVGAPPILVYFSGDWDVHWGHGILTHGHMGWCLCRVQNGLIPKCAASVVHRELQAL